MTHKNIKRFQTEGTIRSDSDIPRLRAGLETLMLSHMRISGYVPVLDVDSAWSTWYNDDTWYFKLTMHGIYLGKKEAQKWEGTFSGKLLPRHTRRNTSGGSLNKQESQ